MARRSSRGTEYPTRHLRSGWSLLVKPGVAEVPLSQAEEATLRQAIPFGRRLSRFRAKAKVLKDATEQDRGRITGLLDQFRSRGIVGVISHRGRKPFRVMVISQASLSVADVEGFREYLGVHAPDVLTGLVIKPAVLKDPARLSALLALLKGAFPDQLDELVELSFSNDELRKRIKREDLPEMPDGLLVETDQTHRVLADHID